MTYASCPYCEQHNRSQCYGRYPLLSFTPSSSTLGSTLKTHVYQILFITTAAKLSTSCYSLQWNNQISEIALH